MTESKQRTSQQNKSLWLMYSELAKVLNEHGWDVQKTIKIDIPWSAIAVHEFIWKPVLKAYNGKKSTTKMTTKEIDEIFEIIVREIGGRCGISLNWPSIETILNSEKIAEEFKH